MASRGIRDRVCIVGMGCIPFGEHWDRSTEDMLLDAATSTLTSTGVTLDDIDAYWLGTAASGISGLAYQTVWLREFRLIFGASTAASAAVLAIFMGGLGVGSVVLGKRADATRNPLALYGFLDQRARELKNKEIQDANKRGGDVKY